MGTRTRTVPQAAFLAGCAVGQVVKSILLQGDCGPPCLFLTSGGVQFASATAAVLATKPPRRAGADQIRRVTGFASGDVGRIGHLTALPVWMDPDLPSHSTVWAAAGAPRHTVGLPPPDLLPLTMTRVAMFTQDEP